MTSESPGRARLDAVCTLVSEQLDPRRGPETLYVGLEHLQSGRIGRCGGGRSTDVQSFKSAFRRGDVLYGKLRPYLDKAIIADADGVCTTELLVLRPREGTDARFLVGLLHSAGFLQHAMSGITGVQHPRTSWQRIREFEFLAFSAAEQRAIGDIVGGIDRAITCCEETLDCLEALRRTAMRELFTCGSRGELQKETEIGRIPESWTLKTVGQIAAVKGGKRLPRGIALADRNTGQFYIRVTDFSDMSVRLQGLQFVPEAAKKAIARYTIAPEDVYISIAGTIGVVGQIPRELDGANLTENAAKVVVQDSNVRGRYLMYALASQASQSQIAQATAKNAQPKLALTRIEQILVPVPCDGDEQAQIIEILDAIGEKVSQRQRKRILLEELFRALLNGLMTGEISVSSVGAGALGGPVLNTTAPTAEAAV